MLHDRDSPLTEGHPLLQVCLDLTASLPAEDRYRRIVAAIRELIPADMVLLVRSVEGGLEPVAHDGAPVVPGTLLPATAGPLAHLLEQTRPVRLREGDPRLAEWGGSAGLRPFGAFLGVSLRVEDEVVGALAVGAVSPDAFDRVPDGTIWAFSGLAAAALRTASLLDTLERERDLLRDHMVLEALVLDISTRFIHLPVEHFSTGIDNALRRVGELVGADRCYLVVVRPRSDGGFSIQVPHEWAADDVEPGRAIYARLSGEPEGQEVCDRASDWLAAQILARNAVQVPDTAAASSELPVKPLLEVFGCKSVSFVPLELSAHIAGAVGFEAVRARREWDDHTLMQLRALGHVLGSAMERQRAAEALRRAHADLERKVWERTQELRTKQGQLVQAEKMAALGQLVAGIAHEVNTPLGAIKSNNDTLGRTFARLRDQLGAPGVDARTSKLLDIGERLCNVSEDAIARITRIVGSMRNFARLDQGELETVDLRRCLDSTLVLVNHMLKGRIKVTRSYGTLPLVRCHASQLNQVFMNLFVNAAQAIEGKGVLSIEAMSDHEDVVIVIEDDGMGIAPHHLPRIFDPGFTTKGVGVGTGLGLAIVHQIVKAHHGQIDVRSVQGQGTRVTLRLPIAAG